MTTVFHVAEGHDGYNAFSSLWPEKFGSLQGNASAQSMVLNAFRAGSAILARNRSDGRLLAATVLDFYSYGDALFVPFILISDAISKRAATQRRMLELVLRAFDASGVRRLLFVTDDTRDHRAAVADFNDAGAKAGLAAALQIVGSADNLYGDRRKVMFNELFIKSVERPNLTARLTDASTTTVSDESERDTGQSSESGQVTAGRSTSGAAGIGAQVLSNRLMTEACCSGCGEKDKEKEKEIGKDQDHALSLGPSGKLTVENAGAYTLYSKIGIERYNPYASDRFAPLV
jgi:hypothetical protein